MENERGLWCTVDSNIEEAFISYFKDIFTSSNPSCMDTVLEAVTPVVSQVMNDRLTRGFTVEEVNCVLAQMHPNKAPSPDGMSPSFFQSCWNDVGGDVSCSVIDILNSCILPTATNFTHIALIPKCKDPVKVTDYRPISLCNVIYKLVAKVLANRLKDILPYVISESQSAFVPGRLITDNVLVAYETLHAMKNKRKGKDGQVALKLDLSKAYDRVEWCFLEEIMRRQGFQDSWIRLILMCDVSFLLCCHQW